MKKSFPAVYDQVSLPSAVTVKRRLLVPMKVTPLASRWQAMGVLTFVPKAPCRPGRVQ